MDEKTAVDNGYTQILVHFSHGIPQPNFLTRVACQLDKVFDVMMAGQKLYVREKCQKSTCEKSSS